MIALARRIGEMLLVLFGISVLAFLIFLKTPGADPAARLAGRNAAPQTLALVRHEFGLDRNVAVQYAVMMRRLFISRDLTSFVNRGQRVVPTVLEAAPVTFSLVLGAAILWVVGAVTMGVLAAALRGGLLDRALMVVGLVGLSMPVFWVAEMVNLLTQSRLHNTWLFRWVPPLGYVPFTTSPVGWCLALVMPWATLALLFVGLYARVLRASLIEELSQDYIRTARAKGLRESRVLLRHALRMSSITFVALFGLDFGALVGGGALLTEVVFNLPGVGRLTYDALLNLDLPMILATVLYSAFFVVVANALVDGLAVLLDPRRAAP